MQRYAGKRPSHLADFRQNGSYYVIFPILRVFLLKERKSYSGVSLYSHIKLQPETHMSTGKYFYDLMKIAHELDNVMDQYSNNHDENFDLLSTLEDMGSLLRVLDTNKMVTY